ncbi:MAG: C10 family peptidase, partial [Candidatus Cloacimonetes bacterium]|nr:C10 family peptidase [Candidatus Cloacimonadota bacterium]
MKKNLVIIFALLLIALSINAKTINQSTATLVAENWMQQHNNDHDFSDKIVEISTQMSKEIVLYYVMHLKDQGFVVVSADDNIEPILAFSPSTKFDEENISPATQAFLSEYNIQIEEIISNNLKNQEAQEKWKTLINNTYINRDNSYRSNLLSTTWAQGTYYNTQCPTDSNGDDGHVVTGCVATAMAQIMKYWAHPTRGEGSHSYYRPVYGTISANFGNATYNWSAMPNNVTNHNAEVAQIMFHAGVSVDMQYGPNGSGAYSEDVPYALTNYFSYNSQAMKTKTSFTDTQWTAMLKGELDNERPVFYAGSGPDGGHAFVCDGYSGTNYFHFNWGWGGYADGYFYLNSLNPADMTFSSNQRAIFGIEPAESDNPNDPNIVILGNPATTYSTNEFPVNFYYKNSLSQTIYLSNEIDRTGTIESIKLTAILNGDISGSKHIKVWLANTNNSSFNNGNAWLPSNQFTQVFDGEIALNQAAGKKTIHIPFETPFEYIGDNLCLMIQRPIDNSYYNSSNKWKASQVSSTRTIYKASDNYNYGPDDYPAGTTAYYIANASLVFSEDLYATDLFFSEYIEGSSNNKALEIFNGTGETVDLSEYKIKLAANGNTWNESNTYQMTGTLAHGETFVICHTQAWEEVKELSDIYPNSGNPTNYNGNDCVALFKNNQMIDIIGYYNLGYNPPNFDAAGVVGALADHTLIRKPSVVSPTTDWEQSAGTNSDDSQWVIQPINYFADLGQHTFSPQASTATHTPTFSPNDGTYYGSVVVAIASATPNANIYYTLDGTDPSNLTTVYTNPISLSETTTLKAIAYAEDLDPSTIATANYTIISPIENANIAELRQQYDDNETIYQLNSEAIVIFKQNYRNQKFVQDATAAILIDDQTNILGDYDLNDGITGIIGKLTTFGGMLQFTPVVTGLPASSTNNPIIHYEISASEFIDNFAEYQSNLVSIDNLEFTSTGSFANGQIYTAVSGSQTIQFRTSFYDVDYIGQAIPSGLVSIKGIANSTGDGNFISARSVQDIQTRTAFPPSSVVAIANNSQVDLSWNEPITSIDTPFSHTSQDDYSNAIGTNSAAQFEVAHRYSPAHLSNFGVAGSTLRKVQFMPCEASATYTLKIYTGGSVNGPGVLVHTQSVPSIIIEEWNEVELTQGVTIPTDTELWIAIDINTPVGFPAACDSGPAVINYGEMMYFGGSWSTLYDLADIDANWMIRGIATSRSGAQTFTLNTKESKLASRGPGAKKNTGKYAFSAKKSTNFKKNKRSIQNDTISRTVTAYNIWRSPIESINNENTWTTIASNITNTNYTDNSWEQAPNGEYVYAVKAIYTNDIMSEPAFSNNVSKNTSSNVTITLATENGESPAGALVTLTNNDNNPAHIYSATATNTSVNFPEVHQGIYTITVTLGGYEAVSEENIEISGEIYNHPTITLITITFSFTEGFEGNTFPPAGWTIIDFDGDTYNWQTWEYTPHSGLSSAASASYDNNFGPLTPDNWLITPQINLDAEYIYALSFWVAPQDPSYPQDKYSILVSTTNNQPASFTEIYTETISASDWEQRTVNLPYAGENIYIALRHYDCTDWYMMKIDDIEITRSEDFNSYVNISGQVNGQDGGISGADILLSAQQSYTTTTEIDGSFSFENVIANTSYTLSVSKEGYQTYTQELQIEEDDVVIPPITLIEITTETLYPPQDLRAEVIGSDVTLAWDEAGAPTTWITHSGMFGSNSVGTNSAADFDVAQRFSAAQLSQLGVAGGQLL